jgi:Mg/Co/Ni transporter MgtE
MPGKGSGCRTSLRSLRVNRCSLQRAGRTSSQRTIPKVPALGVVIGLAMVCNPIAAAGGILIPLALHRLKVDPAVASSSFVTTVTDVVGFFSFLSIATLWFGLC